MSKKGPRKGQKINCLKPKALPISHKFHFVRRRKTKDSNYIMNNKCIFQKIYYSYKHRSSYGIHSYERIQLHNCSTFNTLAPKALDIRQRMICRMRWLCILYTTAWYTSVNCQEYGTSCKVKRDHTLNHKKTPQKITLVVQFATFSCCLFIFICYFTLE